MICYFLQIKKIARFIVTGVASLCQQISETLLTIKGIVIFVFISHNAIIKKQGDIKRGYTKENYYKENSKSNS